MRAPSHRAFTLMELLVVMAVIAILAGLVLGTSSYVQKKGARSRAEAEIAALSAACESYKADNGIYPRDSSTDALQPTQHYNPDKRSQSADTQYFAAGSSAYVFLSGNAANQQPTSGAKSYVTFKPQMVDAQGGSAFIRDPFGNAYGYSTAKAGSPTANVGFNPTFDLWSTAGGITAADQPQWIKNW